METAVNLKSPSNAGTEPHTGCPWFAPRSPPTLAQGSSDCGPPAAGGPCLLPPSLRDQDITQLLLRACPLGIAFDDPTTLGRFWPWDGAQAGWDDCLGTAWKGRPRLSPLNQRLQGKEPGSRLHWEPSSKFHAVEPECLINCVSDCKGQRR